MYAGLAEPANMPIMHNGLSTLTLRQMCIVQSMRRIADDAVCCHTWRLCRAWIWPGRGSVLPSMRSCEDHSAQVVASVQYVTSMQSMATCMQTMDGEPIACRELVQLVPGMQPLPCMKGMTQERTERRNSCESWRVYVASVSNMQSDRHVGFSSC